MSNFKYCLIVFQYILINIHCFQGLIAEDQIPSKKALIFGISGQDGFYLSELLLNKNYIVHGVKRATSKLTVNFHELGQRFFIHNGNLMDFKQVLELIQSIQPDEIYNLAAQSSVSISFEQPEITTDINALGTLRILEAMRQLGIERKTKFYQASTSELFGRTQEKFESENTLFSPCSPYGIAKLFGYWITVNYREAYNVFACNGILFNHESPLRRETFVTRKITLGACRYKLDQQSVLYLGNLNAKRDWGFAKDYVEAMWLMLQHDYPDDYVIATGEEHSVREFVECAFQELGIEIEWHGEGNEEYGTHKGTGNIIVKVDPRFYRPTEINHVLGNAEKAARLLNWKAKTSFKDLIKIMIQADYERALQEIDKAPDSQGTYTQDCP